MLTCLRSTDWIINSKSFKASVDHVGSRLFLTNGLISRGWKLEPNLACISFDNLMTGETLLRAVKPEAEVTINGETYRVGGLMGQSNLAYLTESIIEELVVEPSALKLSNWDVSQPIPRFGWPKNRHHAPNSDWPPKGIRLSFEFLSPDPYFELTVHYELYDGIPALSKWLTVENHGTRPFVIDQFVSEILALTPYEDPVEWREVPIAPPNIHVETDYAFGGFSHKNSSRHSIHWLTDIDFKTQVNYDLQNPCLLHVKPQLGPNQDLAVGQTWESFHTFELVYDSTDRERCGLALKKLYRTIAPWVTENPLILHVVSTDSETVYRAIDQASECGFEMLSLSFGSGIDMEDNSDKNYQKYRSFVDYATDKGIAIGGYSLLSSRRIQPDRENIVNPKTGEPGGQTHGYCPALASNWGQTYFRRLRTFFENTGFLQFTHDGSYPGDIDAAERLPLQKGSIDSQWVQWRIITDFYKSQREKGIYIRVPDYYYLSGANEAGMGYREVNWSLPRIQQQIHTRQNIFDGTWQKTPSMGWMFVPLTQYHGGGADATIEPLEDHLDHYEIMLASNLLQGVQAVYRGLRLYDTEQTRDMVKRLVDLYKKYRHILESDLIHLRRANGRTLDYMLHVNSDLDEKGFLSVFNPTPNSIKQEIYLPLYYTGLTDSAEVSCQDQPPVIHRLDRCFCIELLVEVPANSYTWFVIR